MKKFFIVSLILISIIACQSHRSGTMEVHVEVKGLKKGTMYLQKVVDTLMVTTDSVKVSGANNFTLFDDLESPEMYYVTLADSDKKILFFGEKGKINIKTDLEHFDTDAKITGSKHQDLLNKYNEIISKFNNQQLDLIQADFMAKKNHNDKAIDSIDKVAQSIIKRKYLFATNFAVTHPRSEVSAYIALSDLYNANIKLLDTINNSLSKKVKQSKYGKGLQKFIDDIKASEK